MEVDWQSHFRKYRDNAFYDQKKVWGKRNRILKAYASEWLKLNDEIVSLMK